MILTLVGLLVLAAGGVIAVRSLDGDGGAVAEASALDCDAPTEVKLAAAPELKPQLEAAAKSLQSRDDSGACARFTISAAAPAAVANALATGDENRPDVWVPDSSLWVSRADDGETLPTVTVPSLVTSPLVLVGNDRAIDRTDSWLSAFLTSQPALLDPLTTSTGATSLIALQTERPTTKPSDATMAQLLVPLAQRHGSMAKPYSDLDALFGRATPSQTLVVPAPEQRFVAYAEKHPGSGLRAVVPNTGTLSLDYPMVLTAKKDTEKMSEAAARLAEELRSDTSARALDAAGFRAANGNPLSGGRGAGATKQIGKVDPAVAQKSLQQWATLALSAHSLAVIDASSSMATKVGSRTWMDLTVEAADAGLKLFPDNSQLGLWALSTKLSGTGRDWAPLVPIRPLSAKVGGAVQRQLMLQALYRLKGQIGGSTGLYAASVAAYRTVQDSYDPRSVNAVMIFTDGYSAGSGDLTLEETVKQLQRLRDPARPVRIVAIGMGPDVDGAALAKLARTTGGSSHLARNPADIKKVFIDALQNR